MGIARLNRGGSRAALLGLSTVAALVTCAAVADAATVSIGHARNANLSGNPEIPRYVAATQERNTLTLSTFVFRDDTWVRFDELRPLAGGRNAPLRAGSRCTIEDPRPNPPRRARTNVRKSVFCNVERDSEPFVQVDLGNKDDAATVQSSARLRLIAAGGPGADVIYGGSRGDALCSGDGWSQTDPFLFSPTSSKCSGGEGLDSNALIPFDLVTGGKGNDFLYGDSDEDSLHGGLGGDSLQGGGGDDTLVGDLGHDYLYGEAGDDYLDIIPGVPGSPNNIAGDDYLDGGSGVDFVGYIWASTGGRADLDSGDFRGSHDDFENVDVLYGSNHDDELAGSPVEDKIYALGGNDRIDVSGDPRLSFSDHVECGAGDDQAIGDGRPRGTLILRDGFARDCETRNLVGDDPDPEPTVGDPPAGGSGWWPI